jgi:hypothetical protein
MAGPYNIDEPRWWNHLPNSERHERAERNKELIREYADYEDMSYRQAKGSDDMQTLIGMLDQYHYTSMEDSERYNLVKEIQALGDLYGWDHEDYEAAFGYGDEGGG